MAGACKALWVDLCNVMTHIDLSQLYGLPGRQAGTRGTQQSDSHQSVVKGQVKL